MDILTFDGLMRACLIGGIFALIVLLGEFFRRKGWLVGESARKFVHITAGTWAALWPIFLDLQSIAVVALGCTVFALIFRRWRVFRSVYSIRRISMGEVLIGLGLCITALLAQSGAVYASAVLIIAWSDSMAALVGLRYGKKSSFKVLGAIKSIAGSLAFFVTTFIVVCAFLYYESGGEVMNEPFSLMFGLAIAAFVSLALTVVELTGIYGMDNLTIPVFATVVLNVLVQQA